MLASSVIAGKERRKWTKCMRAEGAGRSNAHRRRRRRQCRLLFALRPLPPLACAAQIGGRKGTPATMGEGKEKEGKERKDAERGKQKKVGGDKIERIPLTSNCERDPGAAFWNVQCCHGFFPRFIGTPCSRKRKRVTPLSLTTHIHTEALTTKGEGEGEERVPSAVRRNQSQVKQVSPPFLAFRRGGLRLRGIGGQGTRRRQGRDYANEGEERREGGGEKPDLSADSQ